MTETLRRVRSLVIATLLAVSTASAAIADNGGPDVEGAHGHPHTAPIADAKLDAFATAAAEIEGISDRYLPKIKSAREAGDKEKARAHANRARQEMTQAIQAQDDISVDEYQDIARHARQDVNLAAKIRQRMGNPGDTDVGATEN